MFVDIRLGALNIYSKFTLLSSPSCTTNSKTEKSTKPKRFYPQLSDVYGIYWRLCWVASEGYPSNPFAYFGSAASGNT
jgi:hypothetical protein